MGDDLVVGRWIRDRARISSDKVAVVTPDGATTYGELDLRSDRLARALVAAGLLPGDRVATLTPNRAEHVELLFACAKAGFVLLPLSWRLTAPELAFLLDDAEPAALFVDAAHEGLAGTAMELATVARPVWHPLNRMDLDALTAGLDRAPARITAMNGDPLFLIYTSGTTGRPKGALLTHANTFWTNLSFDRVIDVREDDVVLTVLPQFHIGGWNVQTLLALWKGATVVLEPFFDAERALALIPSKGVTSMMGVPATYLFLAELDGFATADLSSLRHAVVGGAPMPLPLLQRWHAHGVAVLQGYGLTEAAPNVLCLPPDEAIGRAGAAGEPYPHVEVELRDPTGRRVDGPGSGELLVRGPNVFSGYWRRPDETRAAFTDDGWLRTGDLAERDADGYYRIRDRLKDLYISGGENVSPAEVESVLFEHPGVADAAVVGVPDDRWGEVGVAVVVPRDPATTPKELLAHCASRLAAYKIPAEIRFVDALPRSAVDKVLRTRLRAELGGTA